MRIFRTTQGIVIESDGQYFLSASNDWDSFLNRDDLFQELKKEIQYLHPDGDLQNLLRNKILAPIVSQEVWASGVTYMRSREARMEESKDSGGGDFYAKVYDAERPELFFKATAARTVGPGAEVLIRRDSKWNVPEPELTLCISSSGEIIGYTIGNDMSSRDIEGENPLYLPQAKSYDASAALGPGILVMEAPISPETEISIQIKRTNQVVFENNIQLNRMKRSLPELASWLFRETSFPNGVFLMTGTGIVPPNEFTLAVGDEVFIRIEGIGELMNVVAMR
ncbi:fumarylacetoacetate hydrolase family protein [Haliscomenobacter sp.]|uniref:fumarylacetoacetate hydrolase family protein n=1 Tax=Haliscomenobacter sp. TaxID=2717303 RepID=UPI0035935240